jgi:hypothetical protein
MHNQLIFKENVMMSPHEKWEHDRNIDEIVERLSELLVNIMLMSVKQINDKFLIMKKQLEKNQPDDIPF